MGFQLYNSLCINLYRSLKTFSTMKKKNLNSQVYSTIIYFLYLPNNLRKTALSQIIKSFWGFMGKTTCFTIKRRAITEIYTHEIIFFYFFLSCLWLKMLTNITYTFLRIPFMFCIPEIMIIGKILFTQWFVFRWYTFPSFQIRFNTNILVCFKTSFLYRYHKRANRSLMIF